jgi:virulence-associated protein VapD
MKKVFIRILLVLAILFVISKGLEWLLEANFQDRINSNPDREYDITYEDFDLHTLFKGVTLDKVSIRPLNQSSGTVITGNVDYAILNGLDWADLLFGKRLYIREISFEQPIFEITLGTDTIKKTNGKGIQSMFGDILSRADLNSFSLQNGSVVLKESDNNIKGKIVKVNISAKEIQTDSVQLKNIIPFNMGNLIIAIEDVSYDLNEYTHFKLGAINYNLQNKEIILHDISLGYSIDWVEVSKRLGIQNDIIELEIKTLASHQLEPSNEFYTELDIKAESIQLDSLQIKLQRNKNFARPPDTVKPMFKEMIDGIPLSLEIDSVLISNSTLTYRELGVEKDHSGSIEINQIDALFTGITNIPELQQNLGQLSAQFTANLNRQSKMTIDLIVPYQGESFKLDLDLEEMELTKFNPTLKPLMGVEIESGHLSRIKYHMNASSHHSQNKLIFDYSNLHTNVIKERQDHSEKKRVLLSAIANAAVRNDNMPGQEKYLTAEYQSERNLYRSPINYIIHGLMQGVTHIVPRKNVQKILNKEKKKKN